MNFLPQLQPGPDSDIAQLSFLLLSLSFFFLSFFWINFSIAIHHGKVPHSLSSRLIDNARKMLEGRIGFFLKTFPFFCPVDAAYPSQGKRLVKFFLPFDSKAPQEFDFWTTVMFLSAFPSPFKMREASPRWALSDAHSLLLQHQISSPRLSHHPSSRNSPAQWRNCRKPAPTGTSVLKSLG